MGLRDEKKARLRAQLYEAGMALFAERGFEATRVRDIYERVGVSEATFFNYFPTKQSLLAQSASVARYFYGVYLSHLAARIDEPVPDRIRELVQVVGSLFSADPTLMAAIVGRTNLFSSSTGDTRAADVEDLDRLAELVRQGQDRGEIDPRLHPTQVAELLMAAMVQTITNWLLGWWDWEPVLATRLTAAVDIVLFGCAVSGESRAQEVEHPGAGGLGHR